MGRTKIITDQELTEFGYMDSGTRTIIHESCNDCALKEKELQSLKSLVVELIKTNEAVMENYPRYMPIMGREIRDDKIYQEILKGME